MTRKEGDKGYGEEVTMVLKKTKGAGSSESSGAEGAPTSSREENDGAKDADDDDDEFSDEDGDEPEEDDTSNTEAASQEKEEKFPIEVTFNMLSLRVTGGTDVKCVHVVGPKLRCTLATCEIALLEAGCSDLTPFPEVVAAAVFAHRGARLDMSGCSISAPKGRGIVCFGELPVKGGPTEIRAKRCKVMDCLEQGLWVRGWLSTDTESRPGERHYGLGHSEIVTESSKRPLPKFGRDMKGRLETIRMKSSSSKATSVAGGESGTAWNALAEMQAEMEREASEAEKDRAGGKEALERALSGAAAGGRGGVKLPPILGAAAAPAGKQKRSDDTLDQMETRIGTKRANASSGGPSGEKSIEFAAGTKEADGRKEDAGPVIHTVGIDEGIDDAQILDPEYPLACVWFDLGFVQKCRAESAAVLVTHSGFLSMSGSMQQNNPYGRGLLALHDKSYVEGADCVFGNNVDDNSVVSRWGAEIFFKNCVTNTKDKKYDIYAEDDSDAEKGGIFSKKKRRGSGGSAESVDEKTGMSLAKQKKAMRRLFSAYDRFKGEEEDEKPSRIKDGRFLPGNVHKWKPPTLETGDRALRRASREEILPPWERAFADVDWDAGRELFPVQKGVFGPFEPMRFLFDKSVVDGEVLKVGGAGGKVKVQEKGGVGIGIGGKGVEQVDKTAAEEEQDEKIIIEMKISQILAGNYHRDEDIRPDPPRSIDRSRASIERGGSEGEELWGPAPARNALVKGEKQKDQAVVFFMGERLKKPPTPVKEVVEIGGVIQIRDRTSAQPKMFPTRTSPAPAGGAVGREPLGRPAGRRSPPKAPRRSPNPRLQNLPTLQTDVSLRYPHYGHRGRSPGADKALSTAPGSDRSCSRPPLHHLLHHRGFQRLFPGRRRPLLPRPRPIPITVSWLLPRQVSFPWQSSRRVPSRRWTGSGGGPPPTSPSRPRYQGEIEGRNEVVGERRGTRVSSSSGGGEVHDRGRQFLRR